MVEKSELANPTSIALWVSKFTRNPSVADRTELFGEDEAFSRTTFPCWPDLSEEIRMSQSYLTTPNPRDEIDVVSIHKIIKHWAYREAVW